MTMIAKVISPGPQTTVQDAGRDGMRHLGVPQSGAADRVSFALTNVAVGNPWDTASLECTLGGLVLAFNRQTTIALGGADMAPTLNDQPIALYQSVTVAAGDQLKLGQALAGMRCYIAFAGGIAGTDFLGSVSTHLPARLGGVEGRALCAGDQLNIGDRPVGAPNDIPTYLRTTIGHDWFLRAIPGPEYTGLSDEAQRSFFSQTFVTDRRADRMGLRLTGTAMSTQDVAPMKSSAVFPGTVQCPPDGVPFLLLSDAQTLGGYPRIAQVIEADLPLAGQIRPGDRVWFLETTREAAGRISLQRAIYFKEVLQGFRFS